jgi:hypothetical protein
VNAPFAEFGGFRDWSRQLSGLAGAVIHTREIWCGRSPRGTQAANTFGSRCGGIGMNRTSRLMPRLRVLAVDFRRSTAAGGRELNGNVDTVGFVPLATEHAARTRTFLLAFFLRRTFGGRWMRVLRRKSVSTKCFETHCGGRGGGNDGLEWSPSMVTMIQRSSECRWWVSRGRGQEGRGENGKNDDDEGSAGGRCR